MRVFAKMLVAFAACCVGMTAAAQERLALVIGNSGYDQASGGFLPNPTKDADRIAAALDEVGFDVMLKKDLDQSGLKRAIRDHRDRIINAGPNAVSFFYFSGHGANDSEGDFGGANYIIPIGAELESVRDLNIEAIELEDAIKSFGRANTSFVVFDACRNYPFPSAVVRSTFRGFAVEPETKGTFIAFSSEPGQVALDDSGYAEALAGALRTPGLEHDDVFKRVRSEVYQRTNSRQFSWYRDGVLGGFFFLEKPRRDPETELWEQIKNSCHGMRTYIDLYGDGKHADEAREHLRRPECSTGSTVAEPTEAANTAYSEAFKLYNQGNYADAIPKYQAACDGNYWEACTQLGYMHANGIGFAKNHNEANRLYFRACDNDSARGCNNLAYQYDQGRGFAENDTRALELYMKGCNLGNMGACRGAGYLHRNGMGTAKNDARANELYVKACDGGDSVGCRNLAIAYDYGTGVTQSDSRAYELYSKACDGDDQRGCTSVAYKLLNGEGVEPDMDEGVRLYRIACDEGVMRACNNLAYEYDSGRGISKDQSKALELYTLACEGGHFSACRGAGYLYRNGHGTEPNDLMANELYIKACDGDDGVGCRNLGLAYVNSKGVDQNYDRAVELFEKSCDLEDMGGCNALGVRYQLGQGVREDFGRARSYYSMACDGGNSLACDNLEKLGDRQTP